MPRLCAGFLLNIVLAFTSSFDDTVSIEAGYAGSSTYGHGSFVVAVIREGRGVRGIQNRILCSGGVKARFRAVCCQHCSLAAVRAPPLLSTSPNPRLQPPVSSLLRQYAYMRTACTLPWVSMKRDWEQTHRRRLRNRQNHATARPLAHRPSISHSASCAVYVRAHICTCIEAERTLDERKGSGQHRILKSSLRRVCLLSSCASSSRR